MKIFNIILVLILAIVGIGLFSNWESENDDDPSGSSITKVGFEMTGIESFDEDNRIIYILQGTTQNDVLNDVKSFDGSVQTYEITTSEGSSKSLDEIYEYDRLYVTAENGINLTYYTFLFVVSE